MLVVLTAPRSGSSLVCRILAAHGFNFGECIPGNIHNPHGYYENIALNAMMKRAGKISAGHWVEAPEWWAVESAKIIHEQGITAVKSNVLRAPLWGSYSPEFLIVKRNADHVVESNKTSGMLSAEVLQPQIDAVDQLCKIGKAFCEPDHFFNGYYGGLPRLLNLMGIQFDRSLADSLLDRALWHHKQGKRDE